MKFEIDEEKLAKGLGLTRELMRDLRKKLVKGVDYDFVNRRITFTVEAAKKTAGECGVAWAPEEDKQRSEVRGREDKDRQTSAKITNVYVKNHKYMEAERGGQRIVIRVRDNRHFVLGMEIPAEKLAGPNVPGGALWDFVGRLPRARGVW